MSDEAKMLCCFEDGERDQEPRNAKNVALEAGRRLLSQANRISEWEGKGAVISPSGTAV